MAPFPSPRELGCNWTASSNSSWISIGSGASGSGNGTVNFNVAADANAQPLTGTITLGGAPASQTFTVNQIALPPVPPTLLSPAYGATGVSLTPALTWAASTRATSYDVYLGGAVNQQLIANTTATTYALQGLSANTTYFWKVVAKNLVSSASSTVSSFATFNPSCAVASSPSALLIGYGGGPGTINVSGSTCPWTATTIASWLTISSGAGTGSGTISITANANSGAARIASITFANQTVNVMQGGSPASQFFNDVAPSDRYFDYVSLMYTDGITAGCSTSPSLYCPDTAVTRAQMSVFIVAALDRALGTSLTYTPAAYFQDVPTTSIYFPFVQRIKDLGITAGCSSAPALFCPDDSISQGQMAVFMIVGWMLANNLSSFSYTDVQPGDIYFKFVQKMRDLGLWSGCSQTLYCESSAVNRDQMAPMIMRSLLGAP